MDFFNLGDPATASRFIGLAIPLLVALVTKRVASRGLKGVLNLVLSAVGGSAVYLVAKDGGYDVEGFVNATLNAFVVSVATYYGVYKPTGVSAKLQNKTAGFGLGKPALQTEDAAGSV